MNNEDTPKPKPRIKKILLATVLIIFCFVIVGTISDSLSGNSSTTSASAVAKADQLELLSFKCYSEYGYFQVSGEVKNVSDQPIKNAEVVLTTYTKDGELVNSSDALIDYNPVLAGQTSPFKAGMTMNPAMSKCKVSFKDLLGGTIQTKDSSSSTK
jgi:hypothetical protein